MQTLLFPEFGQTIIAKKRESDIRCEHKFYKQTLLFPAFAETIIAKKSEFRQYG